MFQSSYYFEVLRGILFKPMYFTCLRCVGPIKRWKIKIFTNETIHPMKIVLKVLDNIISYIASRRGDTASYGDQWEIVHAQYKITH